MNLLKTILIAMLLPLSFMGQGQARYVGGDISLLPEYQKAGAKYYDNDGKLIAEFLPWCRQQGMNAMRVRLFVNPKKYKELHKNDANAENRYDPNACQDIEYILPLCQDIVKAGLDLMLDFHYSDTWADPAKQWTPIDWEGLTDEQLFQKIYDYTKESLTTLKEAGVVPSFIQTGNEISYGMLWGPLGTKDPKKAFMGNNANWDRLGKLLNRAINACHEVCPDAKIIIHTERVAQVNVLTNFYTKMDQLKVDYDIIGLSYYPFWHGDMTQLNSALNALENKFPSKDIMIVETGYALRWQVPYQGIIDHTKIWPITEEGQAKFAQDLVDTLDKHQKVDGLFWWWMEYNPYNTNLTGWYNAPLFDPMTGKATKAFKVLCSFAREGAGVGPVFEDTNTPTQVWVDIQGRVVDPATYHGIMVGNGKKLIRR